MARSDVEMVVCGFCRHRMPRLDAVSKILGGREVLHCPKCKGPCRTDGQAEVDATPTPTPTPPPPLPPGEAKRLGLKRKDATAPAPPGGQALPPGAQADIDALVGRMKMHATKVEKRREASRAAIRSIWSAYWFPLKPLSFFAILLMMLVFSSHNIMTEMAMGSEVEDIKAATSGNAPAPTSFFESIVVEDDQDTTTSPGNSNTWVDRYLSLGPAPVTATTSGSPFSGSGGSSRASGLFAGLIALGITSYIFNIFFAMYFAALLLNIIYETGNGREYFPRWPNPIDIVDSFFLPAWHFLLAWVVSFGPALACFVLPFVFPNVLAWLWLAAPLVLFLGFLYFPMTLLSAAMRCESSAVMPHIVLPAIAKAHIFYIPVLIAFLLIPVWPFARVLLQQADLGIIGWKAVLLDYFVQFTLLVIGMRALGLLYRRIEDRLGWLRFHAI